MRSSKSRSRNKSGNRNRPTGGNIVNRVFDSSGPEGKVRGTPQQIIEKYSQLARDAQLAGDRVATENFYQHAEHYTRMLAEAQREIDQRREQQEQQHRERQQQQAEARGDRGEPQQNTQQQPHQQPHQQPQGKQPPRGDEPQPEIRDTRPARTGDVIDVVPGDEGGSGLVETPESKPEKPARPRRQRHAPKSDEAAKPKGDGEPAKPTDGDAAAAAE